MVLQGPIVAFGKCHHRSSQNKIIIIFFKGSITVFFKYYHRFQSYKGLQQRLECTTIGPPKKKKKIKDLQRHFETPLQVQHQNKKKVLKNTKYLSLTLQLSIFDSLSTPMPLTHPGHPCHLPTLTSILSPTQAIDANADPSLFDPPTLIRLWLVYTNSNQTRSPSPTILSLSLFAFLCCFVQQNQLLLFLFFPI